MNYDKSLIGSFRYALEGIWHALKNNRNLRVDFLCAFLVFFLGWYFQINSLEIIILLVTVLIVISAEMINTSLEEMVNLITSEHKKEAKIAKDVAAGMVLITAIGSVIIGILIFATYVSRFFVRS
jgi:diacylglycerol kinase (ATP)